MAIMFTGLARVAKKTGFPVEEVDGWEKTGHGGMHSCSTIVIHHTAGANNGKDYNSYGTVKNGRPGLPGPLAQLGVGRNTGTVYVFAAGKSWHAGTVGKTAHNNDNAIGIEIENNGVGEKYSSNAYNSAVALAGELVKEFKLTVNDVLGHKEIAVDSKGRLGRKIDPSFGMGKFREDVRKYIAGDKLAKGSVTPQKKPSAPAPQKPAPKPSNSKQWPYKALAETGTHNAESHAAWVKLLAGVGYKDANLTTNMQRWLKKLGYYKGWIEADRKMTPEFGPMLIEALQTFLVDKKLLPNKAYIDRKRQSKTIIAEKKYLNSQARYYK